jgi:cobalt-zinc-cadmium efflux system protein
LRKADEQFQYGYQRFSILSALSSGIILWTGSLIVLKEAVERLFNPEPISIQMMLGLAILGVLVNGAAFLRLKKGTSLNLKMASLHILEDMLGWVAVLLNSVIMLFYQNPILDAILCILLTIYMLYRVNKDMKVVMAVLLQKTPPHIDALKLQQKILALPDVQQIKEWRMWTLDNEHHVLALRITVHSIKESTKLKQEIRHILKHAHIVYQHIEIDESIERTE